MSDEIQATIDPPTKPKNNKRKPSRRRRQPRGPIEVRAGGRWYYAYDVAYVPCGVLLRLHDRQVVIPVGKPIEIYNGPVGEAVPAPSPTERRAYAYDPQLPHNERGNLSAVELEERERERERQVAEFKARRDSELEDLQNGATPFAGSLVGN